MTNRIKFAIEQETLDNQDYRKAIFTGDHLQVVLMSLKPREEIGKEIHQHTDQFFRIEKGKALFTLNDRSHYNLKSGDAIVVPAGTYHNVTNVSSRSKLKLYTIYAPPKHPAGTIERSKPSE
jgi:mannose-6-phosphate isomerase-like protein (cupin superfamily)